MIYINKTIVFSVRIMASTFSSIFVGFLVVTAWFGLSYMSLRYEQLSNLLVLVNCYGLHAVQTCEFHFLILLDSLFTLLSEVDSDILNRLALEVLLFSSQYGVSDFLNTSFESCISILKNLIQFVYYAVPGLIGVLFFKFMWNDIKPKNSISDDN
jgi:hypothetical protein